MTQLTPNIYEDVQAAAAETVHEASLALERGLGMPCQLAVIGGGGVDLDELTRAFSGPGLVLSVAVDETAALVMISAASGVLPEWCALPTASDRNRLKALAQELGMLLLPEQCAPTEFQAGRVDDLVSAVGRTGLIVNASCLWMSVKSENGPVENVPNLAMVWPVSHPEEAFRSAAPVRNGAGSIDDSEPACLTPSRPTFSSFREAASYLHAATRSQLKIKVPFRVTLASRKMSMDQVLQLNRGSLLQFEKHSQKPLAVEIGECSFADGEVVKIGDRYGIRLTGLRAHEERFRATDSEVRDADDIPCDAQSPAMRKDSPLQG